MRHNVLPDVLTTSKSFGGGKASISAYVCRKHILEKAYGNVLDATLHTSTYNGFGEECITAIEAINIMQEDNYEEKYAGYDPNSPESFIGLTLMQEEYLDQSIMLAGLIQNNFTNNLKRKDRSVKQAGFIVLHQSYMPSVLVETGFLTNNKEGAYLNSKKGQREMAASISDAVLRYKKNIDLSTSSAKNPVITEEEIEKAISETETNEYEDVVFKVQILASSKKMDTKPSNFQGLKDVSRDKEGGLFKYYYGDTSDYNKITLMKTFAQEKGYPSAYIVAFKKGEKVKLSQVLTSKDK